MATKQGMWVLGLRIREGCCKTNAGKGKVVQLPQSGQYRLWTIIELNGCQVTKSCVVTVICSQLSSSCFVAPL